MSDQDNTTQTEITPCPFCGCSMSVVSNRDFHRMAGNHASFCFLYAELGRVHDTETDHSANENAIFALIKFWNRRA